MPKWRVAFGILAINLCFTGCYEDSNCLMLYISSVKASYAEDEPFDINITLHNGCNRELVVMDPSWEYTRLFCEMRNSLDKPAEIAFVDKTAGPGKLDYLKKQIRLAPGQAYRVQRATNYAWGENMWRLRPGVHTHWCEYNMPRKVIGIYGEHLDPPEFRGPLKKKLWFGDIKSNTIKIVIKSTFSTKN